MSKEHSGCFATMRQVGYLSELLEYEPKYRFFSVLSLGEIVDHCGII